MTKITSNPDNQQDYDTRMLHSIRQTSRLSAFKSVVRPNKMVREERKKVLKTSVRKLKDIDDPETFLCRSVLINNTMKRLQTEIRIEREDKRRKKSLEQTKISNEHHFYNGDNAESTPLMAARMVERSLDDRISASDSHEAFFHPHHHDFDIMDESSNSSTSSSSSNDDEEEAHESSEDNRGQSDEDEDNLESASALMKQKQRQQQQHQHQQHQQPQQHSLLSSDSDTQNSDMILSNLLPDEVYMPPPQLISHLDDQQTTHPADDSASDSFWNEFSNSTRPENWTNPSDSLSSLVQEEPAKVDCDSEHSNGSVSPPSCAGPSSYCSPYSGYRSSSSDATATTTTTATSTDPSGKRFSCGQTSMFEELQSVVFSSLIASLET